MQAPFVVVIDSREQLPFAFAGLRTDAREGREEIAVRSVVRTLRSGDYSLEGHEAEVAVERKSLEDAYHSIGRDHDRFRREIVRLSAMRYAAVVIEADWQTILESPPPLSQLSPKIVFRTILAWQMAYPSVHWWTCRHRRQAEITTFRILERFWKHHRGAVSPSELTSVSSAACEGVAGLRDQLADRTEECDRLREIVESLAARVAAQSELLTQVAQRPAIF